MAGGLDSRLLLDGGCHGGGAWLLACGIGDAVVVVPSSASNNGARSFCTCTLNVFEGVTVFTHRLRTFTVSPDD